MFRAKLYAFTMLAALLAAGAATAQPAEPVAAGTRVKGEPSEILYHPRFGTPLMLSESIGLAESPVFYDRNTREIILSGLYDSRTGQRLRTAAPAVNPTAPMQGTRVKGSPEEMRYHPRYGTSLMPTESIGLSESPMFFDRNTREIILNGLYDSRTGQRLRSSGQAEVNTGAPLQGTRVKGTPDEIRYHPRYGTTLTPGESVALSESPYFYDRNTREIILDGQYDSRTGHRLRTQ